LFRAVTFQKGSVSLPEGHRNLISQQTHKEEGTAGLSDPHLIRNQGRGGPEPRAAGPSQESNAQGRMGTDVSPPKLVPTVGQHSQGLVLLDLG
jgi:hypothetical protein